MVIQNKRALRRQRIFRDRNNPLDYLPEEDSIQKYRLTRKLILQVCVMVRDDIDRPTNRSSPLSVSLQVMVALRFYATGTFQSVVGDIHMISKASVSRTRGNCPQMSRVYFDAYFWTRLDSCIRAQFRQLSVLLNVFGGVDGTHPLPLLNTGCNVG